MSNAQAWLGYGNIACLLPLTVMMFQYVIRTRWKGSPTGRALAWIITLTFFNFILNLAGTTLTGDVWDWTRVAIKFMIAAGLVNMLRIMENARDEAILNSEEAYDLKKHEA